MTTLYVANVSKQRHDFNYRIPEENSIRRQQIMPGQQITVYQPDAAPEVLRAIVDQHTMYGLIDAAEIDRKKPFIGLCYSFDKPIKVEKIMYGDEHNQKVLTQNSQDARRHAAAALHQSISAATDGAAKLEALDLEIVEQNDSRTAGLNEIISVSHEGQEAPPRRRPTSRRN